MNNPWGSSKRLVNDKLGSVMSPESVESSHGDAGEAGDHDLRVATELGMSELSFYGLRGNPIVITMSLMSTWIMILVAVLDSDRFFGLAAESKRWLTSRFTWFYIAAQNIWVFFIISLAFNKKIRGLKLGRQDSEPEYRTVSWFMMMFGTAGVGTGLFYYGVGEPILHMGYNRYVAKSYLSYNELAQEAMNLTFYHWGIHAWMCYTVVGLTIGVTSHRLGLPMTIRSAYFPLFGHAVYGFTGDAIDALAICTTLVAICTSMASGAIQITTGISMLNPAIPRSTFIHIILVIAMTLMASISAHAGLRHGVRILSIVSFMIMLSMLIMVGLVDDTVYLLNVLVQSLGHHIQWYMQLGFHTDAFEQLEGSVDGKSGPPVWMDWWTVFYWCNWVSWSSLVGIFIAKISKGRTVMECITASLTGPVLFSFIWFSVFGGAGLRMERQAVLDGCLGNCKTVMGGVPFDRSFCKPLNQARTAESVAAQEASFLARRPEGCSSITQLSTRDISSMWFDVLMQYENVGMFLVVVSLICMILFVVTTNDSGSIVLDSLAANGPLKHERTKPIQKQLWSFSLGLMATILLIAGGTEALSAMQTIIIALGLPNTLLVTVMCTSLSLVLKMETHPDTVENLSVLEGRYDVLFIRDNGMEFWNASVLGVTSVLDYIVSLGHRSPHLNVHMIPENHSAAYTVAAGARADQCPSKEDWKLFFTAFFAPWYMASVIWVKGEGMDSNLLWTFSKERPVRAGQGILAYTFLFFNTAFILVLIEIGVRNIWVIGFTFYLFFVFMITAIRSAVRHHHDINGDLFRDLMACLFFYPFTLVQMYHQVQTTRELKDK